MNLFSLLNENELNKYTYLKNYKAGDIVFNEDGMCNYMGYLEKGSIRIIEITYTEKEETITYLSEDSYFGDILIFSNNPIYLGHAICEKKTTIRYISKNNLLLLFQEKPQFLTKFLELISTKALLLKQEIKLFKHKNITDRLIYFLNNQKKIKKSSKIPIKNVTTLAKVLSLPRPSLAREISKLEKEGIIVKIKENNMLYLLLK